MSVEYWPDIGQVSANSVGRVSVECWSSIGLDIDTLISADSVGRVSTETIGRVSAEMSVEYWPRYLHKSFFCPQGATLARYLKVYLCKL